MTGTQNVVTKTPAPQRAFRNPRAVAVFVAIAAVGLAADLLSKHYVFSDLLSDPDLPWKIRCIQARQAAVGGDPLAATQLIHLAERPLGGGVKLTLSTNPGIVFGLRLPRTIVAVATVLTIGLVIYFFASSDRRAYWVHTAMALILAGALGNLYDRLLSNVVLPVASLEPIRYQVRDFINCEDLYYPPVFNVADVWLVAGVAMLTLYWLLETLRQNRSRKTTAAKQ